MLPQIFSLFCTQNFDTLKIQFVKTSLYTTFFVNIFLDPSINFPWLRLGTMFRINTRSNSVHTPTNAHIQSIRRQRLWWPFVIASWPVYLLNKVIIGRRAGSMTFLSCDVEEAERPLTNQRPLNNGPNKRIIIVDVLYISHEFHLVPRITFPHFSISRVNVYSSALAWAYCMCAENT